MQQRKPAQLRPSAVKVTKMRRTTGDLPNVIAFISKYEHVTRSGHTWTVMTVIPLEDVPRVPKHVHKNKEGEVVSEGGLFNEEPIFRSIKRGEMLKVSVYGPLDVIATQVYTLKGIEWDNPYENKSTLEMIYPYKAKSFEFRRLTFDSVKQLCEGLPNERFFVLGENGFNYFVRPDVSAPDGTSKFLPLEYTTKDGRVIPAFTGGQIDQSKMEIQFFTEHSIKFTHVYNPDLNGLTMMQYGDYLLEGNNLQGFLICYPDEKGNSTLPQPLDVDALPHEAVKAWFVMDLLGTAKQCGIKVETYDELQGIFAMKNRMLPATSPCATLPSYTARLVFDLTEEQFKMMDIYLLPSSKMPEGTTAGLTESLKNLCTYNQRFCFSLVGRMINQVDCEEEEEEGSPSSKRMKMGEEH